jgi:hypothetical protein
MKRTIARLARYASDKDVLVLTPGSLCVLGGLLLMAALYIALCLNQSSIGVWNRIYGPPAPHSGLSLGSPKDIRSDEWNTLTPWILNQFAKGFPRSNDDIGGQRSAVLTGTPVSDAIAVVQPKFWGFYILPEAYGFSWSWAWKTFATLAALYLMLLAVTDGDRRWSLLGAAWIYGSSYTQWWLSNGLPETICGSALAILGALYLLRSQRLAGLIVGAATVAFAVCNLLTYLYPASQYPLLWLAVAIVAGKTIENRSWTLIWQRKALRLTAVAFCVLGIALFVYHFIRLTLPTIRLVLDTVYPGKRLSMGGDVPFYRLFDGFFEGFRLGEKRHPLGPNASEASNFVLLFPFVVLLVPFRELLRRDQALPLCLTAYCLFVCAWIALPLPDSVRSVIAAMGWNLSPAIRSVLGVGLGSIVLTCVIGARIASGALSVRRFGWFLPPVAGLLLIGYGRMLQGLDPLGLRNMMVLAGALSSALVLSGLYSRRARVAAVGVGMFIMMPLGANPLVSGLAPILGKPILQLAKNVSSPEDNWMVVGDFVFSQGLKAQGLSVVTGSEYLPDRRTIAALDPQHRYSEIWNRYAHILVASDPSADVPHLTLNQADLYTASLSVCGEAPRAWGVTMVAYTVPVPAEDRGCLESIPDDTASGVSLFRLKQRNQAQQR